MRTSPSFIGGEILADDEKATIGDFYNTIRELGVFKTIYNLAEKKFFDIYEQLKNFSFLFVKLLMQMLVV